MAQEQFCQLNHFSDALYPPGQSAQKNQRTGIPDNRSQSEKCGWLLPFFFSFNESDYNQYRFCLTSALV